MLLQQQIKQFNKNIFANTQIVQQYMRKESERQVYTQSIPMEVLPSLYTVTSMMEAGLCL